MIVLRQQFKITFAGDTTGSLSNDSAKRMFIEWWLYDHGYYSGGAIPTSWEAQADGDRNSNATGGAAGGFAGNTANDWAIAGIQFELGSYANKSHWLLSKQ